MFRPYNRQVRWRAAIALAALYAFCVLLPTAALALTQAAAHCLTGSNGASHVHRTVEKAPEPHSHANATQHDHGHDAASQAHGKTNDEISNETGDNTGDKSHGGNCCGLFCVSAIAHDNALSPAVVLAAAKDSPALADALVGHAPDRINRPPIR